jgi:hypothetical protein
LRSDARTDAARVSFAETPPQARLPASAGESWQSQSSPSFEVQLSALSTKVAALEEAKDKVDALQASLKEVEKRADFLQKANEVRSFSFFLVCPHAYACAPRRLQVTFFFHVHAASPDP